MKKPSFIIGKKQIILTCMTLMLCIAVYVNYAVSDKSLIENAEPVNGEITASSSVNDKATEAAADADGEVYGESQFVNADGTGDFFAQARLEKMTNRDEAVQTLQTIMGGGDITEDEMVTNALEAVEVSKLIESEGNIETLIKAQGIEDCVCYLDGESAKLVVKTEGLEKAQAAAIKDIILGEVTIPAENIRIFEVK